MVHFAKIFGVAWAVNWVLYLVAILFFGISIYWPRQWGLSKNLMGLLFWAWPAVLALVVAAFWESIAVALTLFRSKSHV